MKHRSIGAIATALVATAAALVAPSPAAALPLGQHLVIVTSTTSIVTGDDWHVTAEVDDLLGTPVSGATVWTGSDEPSLGCGADLAAAACTGLATKKKTVDATGQISLTGTATLDTFVVLYLDDGQGGLDPNTGQQVSIRTHNSYAWSGPASATLKQFSVGAAPYVLAPGQPGSSHLMATGAGAAKTLRTAVSTDGGAHWTVVGRGTHDGAFPITTANTPPVRSVNLMASKPGTYSVRITDAGGTFEDPGVSPIVTVTVTGRTMPHWLKRTNAFRVSLGLAPVADNPVYDAALAQHVRWMNLNKQLSHSEPAGSKGYSKAGNEAASASDLAYGRPTPARTVDGWIGAPFHASCLLNAYWAVGGFATKNTWSGEWCHSDMQTLDLATGTHGPVRSTLRKNYTFPSSAMTVPLTIALNGNEAPDPVAGCASRGLGAYWTVPVIFRVARPPAADKSLRHASAAVKTKSGHRLAKTCLLTGSTYNGPDAGSTQIGRLILGNRTTGRWAIVLVKAGSFKAGHAYTATLTDGKFTQRTSFRLAKQ